MSPIRLILLALSWSSLQLTAEVLAEYQQSARKDSHRARLPALTVAQSQPATPLLKPGPFQVTWSGTIEIEKRQRLNFSFEGQGSAALTIDGKELLKEDGTLGATESDLLRLDAGSYPFTLSYQSPEKETAHFQLFWRERAFPREPMPTSAFGKIDPALAESSLAYQGREIFTRHLCSKCHLPEDGFGPDALPELAHIPPILGLTGDRLKQDWIAEWLFDPTSFRQDTNMPRLVAASEDGRQEAADLAAYLMTLKTGSKSAPLKGSAQDGGVVFHNLACVSCHGLPDDTKPSEGRLSLAHLSRKFEPQALRDYLLDPSQLAPHTRMPDFQLSEEEASNLAQYLLETTAKSDEPVSFPQGDVSTGTTLASEKHCGACHAGLPYDPQALPSFKAIVTKSWETSPCYQSEESHLNLPEGAGEALEALRSEHLDSLRSDTPASYVQRQIRNLRCHACHSEDDQIALLPSVHNDTADLIEHLEKKPRFDQSLPPLTYTGEKLHSKIITQFLAGDSDARARPWLGARMPGFKNFEPETIAVGLASRHGLAPSQPDESETNPAMVKIGENLIGSNKGFSCTACHALLDQEATSPWEVKGINFNLTHQRLRESYFEQWMNNPRRIDPATRMPRYADEDGETALPILKHDSQQQFQAIWQYLQTLEE